MLNKYYNYPFLINHYIIKQMLLFTLATTDTHTTSTTNPNLFLTDHLILLLKYRSRTIHINSLYDNKLTEYSHNNMIKYNLFSRTHMIYNLADDLVMRIYKVFMDECCNFFRTLKIKNVRYSSLHNYLIDQQDKNINRMKATLKRIKNNIQNNLKGYSQKTKIFIAKPSALYMNCHTPNDTVNTRWITYHSNKTHSHSKDPYNKRFSYNSENYYNSDVVVIQKNQDKTNNDLLDMIHRERRFNRVRFKTFINGFTRNRIIAKLLKDKGLGDGTINNDKIVWERLSWNEMVFGVSRQQDNILSSIVKKTMNYSYGEFPQRMTIPATDRWKFKLCHIEGLWKEYNKDPENLTYIAYNFLGEVGFNHGRIWENRYDKWWYKSGRISSLLKVKYKYDYQQYQRIKYTNDKKVNHITPNEMEEWWKMSLQDRKYSKWFIDLQIAINIRGMNITVNGVKQAYPTSIKDRLIHRIKRTEYDSPYIFYYQVVKDRYNYITRTHPNRACRLYSHNLFYKYIGGALNLSISEEELWSVLPLHTFWSVMFHLKNDYGADKVYSKLYGKDYKSRTIKQSQRKFKIRRKMYHERIKEFSDILGSNYIFGEYYKQNPHIKYLNSYHSY